MTEEIISWSISTKVWDQAGIELTTPGSAVGLATDCATGRSLNNNPALLVFNPWASQTHYVASG